MWGHGHCQRQCIWPITKNPINFSLCPPLPPFWNLKSDRPVNNQKKKKKNLINERKINSSFHRFVGPTFFWYIYIFFNSPSLDILGASVTWRGKTRGFVAQRIRRLLRLCSRLHASPTEVGSACAHCGSAAMCQLSRRGFAVSEDGWVPVALLDFLRFLFAPVAVAEWRRSSANANHLCWFRDYNLWWGPPVFWCGHSHRIHRT